MADALPTWEECKDVVDEGVACALETFIYHNEPADVGIKDSHTEAEFRAQLAAVISEAKAEVESAPCRCYNCVKPNTDEPPDGLLLSMAIRSDHGLGCPGYYDSLSGIGVGEGGVTHAMRLEMTMREMRKLWEEVTGRGFWHPGYQPPNALPSNQLDNGEPK